LKRSRLWLACAGAILVGLVVLNATRSRRTPSASVDDPALSLKNLALLEPKRLLAKVGDVELRSEDLREVLQSEFHGQMSHAGLSAEDLGLKVGQVLDALVQDELLAQAARQDGLRTNQKGCAGRKDLASQYLAQNLSKVPAVDEADLRNFYKNHGEKFVIPARVQVRELFLPLQGPHDRKDKTKDNTYVLGQEVAERIRNGESWESLAAQYVPEGQRDRAQVHELRGAPMEAEDEKKVLALRPGEVVGPLRIEGGYSVFQGETQVRSGRIPFYEAREKIKTYLEARRVEGARQQLVANLQQQKPVQRFAPDKTLAAVH
jgi:parvulin-like peptidyl-prolyl cis-trans isomerase-like protein